MQWQHFTQQANGINIHYVAAGEGEPVILLHGWPEFWYSWRNQLPVLGQTYRAIAPDMRGFGYSDKPLSGYDTRTAATDMYELARALGYDSVRLVAHDIGARVAFRFTLDHPEAVRKLALIDSTPPIEQLGNQPPAAIRERWHSYFHQQFDLPEKLIEGREEIYLRHIFRDWCINKYPISDDDVAHYVKAYSQPGSLRGGFSYYRAAAYQDPPDWRADVDRVLDTPMLFLFGVRRARTAEVMGTGPLEDAWRRFFPNAVGKDLGNYGHFLQWETPEAVNRELLEFLRG